MEKYLPYHSKLVLQADKGKNDANQQKANELLDLLLQADIIKFAHFLMDIISVLSVLSRASQNRNSSIADIFTTLESTLKMLQIYQSRWQVEDIWGSVKEDSLTRGILFQVGIHLILYLGDLLPDQGQKNAGWIQPHTFMVTTSRGRKTSLPWERWF